MYAKTLDLKVNRNLTWFLVSCHGVVDRVLCYYDRRDPGMKLFFAFAGLLGQAVTLYLRELL